MNNIERNENKLSFKFNKNLQNKRIFEKSNVRDPSTVSKTNSKKYISHFTSEESKHKEFVIPCSGNTFKMKNRAKSNFDVGKDSTCEIEDQKAVKEIIEECYQREQGLNSSEKDCNALEIIKMRNKSDSYIHGCTEILYDVPKAEDYENVPIQGYGMAMLRGMGFDKDGEIRKFQKVNCLQPQLRPKGLGLGAAAKQSISALKEDVGVEHEIVKGAYVVLRQDNELGNNMKNEKIICGLVAGIDVENARVIVLLDENNSCISVSMNKIKKVCEKPI